jgi:hypothetical protein
MVKATANAKTKYRGLSTTTASAPPPVEMTVSVKGMEENMQSQKQERSVEGLHPTLRQVHAKDGAPERSWWVEE